MIAGRCAIAAELASTSPCRFRRSGISWRVPGQPIARVVHCGAGSPSGGADRIGLYLSVLT